MAVGAAELRLVPGDAAQLRLGDAHLRTGDVSGDAPCELFALLGWIITRQWRLRQARRSAQAQAEAVEEAAAVEEEEEKGAAEAAHEGVQGAHSSVPSYVSG